MRPAIRVENLGKQYLIGEHGPRYRTLRESLTKLATAPFRRLFSRNGKHAGPLPPPLRSRSGEGHIWAIKEVSFEVPHGQVLGIIGRNGAGKSTLLKVLSRITEPTVGYADVCGRVGSLLEVGTGFHPELTGRENVYLSGAILGMRHREMERKFDEIVAFAGVDNFIDTAVKRYSSGMYMRLAFAVAAHLETEVLLIDEVLAVGDLSFQKKCLGKMEDVAHQDRTVLFVSHNMHAVTMLCSRALLISDGKVVNDGPAREVIQDYVARGVEESTEAEWSFADAPGDEIIKVRSVWLSDLAGQRVSQVGVNDPLIIGIDFWRLKPLRVSASFHIFNRHGIMVFATANLHHEPWWDIATESGLYRCRCLLPGQLLNTGPYYVNAFVSCESNGKAHAALREVLSFEVIEDGCGRGRYVGPWPGVIRPLLNWHAERLGNLSETGVTS